MNLHLPARAPRLILMWAIAILAAVLLSNSPIVNGTADSRSSEQKSALGAFQPTEAQIDVTRDIARQLQYAHYRALRLDSAVSSQVFDNYLDALDGQRLYLTAEDVREFEDYRYRLDGALKSGQLEPAFAIYNRFHQRLLERLDQTLSLLAKGIDQFDFNTQDSLELDREGQPWAADNATLDALWTKRIKSAILAQRLDGKDNDSILKSLVRRYETQKMRATQTRSEDVFQTFMNALTNTYDPHTAYFSPRTSENFNINMSLSLEGIGAVLQADNEFTKVVRLVPAGPADRNGLLRPADRIVGVGQGADGEVVNVIGWRLEEVVDLIRGPKLSTVRLEVIPAKSTDENATRLISIVRDKVKLEDQSARSEVITVPRGGQDWRLGIIQLPTFYADFRGLQAGDPEARSTTRDVERLIRELQTQGIDGLIIDLRNNGGGALQEAIALTGLFIPEGPTVQVRTADNRVRVYDDPDDAVLYNGPLAVLVNRMSASASEIFAAAIQDYGRGLVVGEQTFGKGTVQSVRGLGHGQLKITEAKFYRISGGSTQHKGVIPDILMPSAIDKTEIGEDALPEALPWDQIAPVTYRRYAGFEDVLTDLSRRHQARMEQQPEYQALLQEIDFVTHLRDQKRISLNETQRREELETSRTRELGIVNAKRTAEGKDPFKTYADYEVWQEEQATRQERQDLVDFQARETAEVLVDSMTLRTQVATH